MVYKDSMESSNPYDAISMIRASKNHPGLKARLDSQ